MSDTSEAESTDYQPQQNTIPQCHPSVVVYRFNDNMVYAKGDPNYDVRPPFALMVILYRNIRNLEICYIY